MEAYDVVEVQIHSFLSSAHERDDSLYHIIPQAQILQYQFTESWMGPRVCLVAVAKLLNCDHIQNIHVSYAAKWDHGSLIM